MPGTTTRMLLIFLLACLSLSLPGMANASPEECIASVQPDKPVTKDVLKLCQKAFDEGADGSAFLYAYGRALAETGDKQAANRVLTWAAEDGSQLARDALMALGEAVPDVKEMETKKSQGPAQLSADELFAKFADETGAQPEDVVHSVATTIETLAYPALVQPRDRLLHTREGSRAEKALLLRDVFDRRFAGTPVRFSTCEATSADAALVAKRPAQLLSEHLPIFLAKKDLKPELKEQIEAFAKRWSVDKDRATREVAALKNDIEQLEVPAAKSTRLVSQHIHFGFQKGATWQDFDLATGSAVDTGGCQHPETLSNLQTEVTVKLIGQQKGGAEAIVWQTSTPFSGGLLFGFAEPTGLKPPTTRAPADSMAYTPFVYTADGKTDFGNPVIFPASPAMLKAAGNAVAGTTSAVNDAFGKTDDGSKAMDLWQTMRFEISLSGPGTEADISRFELFNRALLPEGTMEPLPEALGIHAPFLQVFSTTPIIGAAKPYFQWTGKPKEQRDLLVLRDVGSAIDVLRRAAYAELSPSQPPLNQTVGYFVLGWNLAGSGDSLKSNVTGHLVRGLELAADPVAWAVASATAEGALLGAQDVQATAVTRWQAERQANSKTIAIGNEAALTPFALPAGAQARAAARLNSGETLLASENALNLKDGKSAVWWAISTNRLIIEDEDLSGYRPANGEEGMNWWQVMCRAAFSYKNLSRVVAVAVVATSAATVAATLDGPMSGMEAAMEWSQQASEEGMKRSKEGAEGAGLIGAACVAAGGPPK